MKVVLAGGRGQVGQALEKAHIERGHQVFVLTRQARRSHDWAWDGRTLGDWADRLDGCDLLINLAGQSVNCRYTPKNRSRLFTSRIASTQILGTALQKLRNPPKLWLQASTATIYPHRLDGDHDEDSAIADRDPGHPWDFSIDIARSWEACFDAFDLPHTRKVALRSAMTMGTGEGGIFETLLRLVRWGLGGSAGPGTQYVSWIHERDFIRALDLVIADDDWQGVTNFASPHPLPYADFMAGLRRAWGQPIGLPAPTPILAMGAWLMGTEMELVLKSRRVVSKRLAAAGFEFDYSEWSKAAQALCSEYRARGAPTRASAGKFWSVWFVPRNDG